MFKKLPIPFWYVMVTGMVLGVVIGFKSFIPYMYWGDTENYVWYRSALPHVVNYFFWPLLVPFIYWAFQRYRINRAAPMRQRLIAVLIGLAVPLFHEIATSIIYFAFMESIGVVEFNAKIFKWVKAAFPSVYIGRIVEYWIIYGLFASFDYYKKYKDKQAEVGRMEAQLNRTKLAVLKMQLQPHFLFNALNSISSLMDIDVKKAQAVTARLGDLLRGILEQDERVFIRVEEELHYVKTYLEIEKVRFDDRLEVSIDADPSLLGAELPMLLIQPLAENAIKHGVAKVSRDTRIEVSVKPLGTDRFKITVSDNGAGQSLEARSLFDKGVGLSNIKARLKQLYDHQYKLHITTSEGNGFQVEIELPKQRYHENHPNLGD